MRHFNNIPQFSCVHRMLNLASVHREEKKEKVSAHTYISVKKSQFFYICICTETFITYIGLYAIPWLPYYILCAWFFILKESAIFLQNYWSKLQILQMNSHEVCIHLLRHLYFETYKFQSSTESNEIFNPMILHNYLYFSFLTIISWHTNFLSQLLQTWLWYYILHFCY